MTEVSGDWDIRPSIISSNIVHKRIASRDYVLEEENERETEPDQVKLSSTKGSNKQLSRGKTTGTFGRVKVGADHHTPLGMGPPPRHPSLSTLHFAVC
jgi:hypothetical protein